MDEQIKEIVDRYKERINYFILSQPERITPLQQCEAVSNQIDSLVEDIWCHLTNTMYSDGEGFAAEIHEQVHNGASISDIMQLLTRRR